MNPTGPRNRDPRPAQTMDRRRWFSSGIALTASAVAMISVGCGRPAPEAGGTPDEGTERTAGKNRPPADERLASIFQRYRGTAYYSDNARVILRFQQDGRTQTRMAPLRVRRDGGRLAVDAYAARIRVAVDDQGTRTQRAWFDESETANFDRQVLTRKRRVNRPGDSSDSLSLDWILADEVLRSRLSAGLGGPPPQLEWLLSPDPMHNLFSDDVRLSYLPDAEIDGRMRTRILARTTDENYVFWIDPQMSLIRRVDLPVPDAGEVSAPAGSLSLDLRAATFTPAASPDRFADSPSFTARRVREFIPPPPPPPSELLGHQVTVPESNAPVDHWLILAVDQAPARTVAAASQALAWGSTESASPRPSRKTPLGIAVVGADRPTTSKLNQAFGPQVVLRSGDRGDRLRRQLRLPSGGAALLDTDGGVLMVQPQWTPSSSVALVTAWRDARAGVDVVARIRGDY